MTFAYNFEQPLKNARMVDYLQSDILELLHVK